MTTGPIRAVSVLNFNKNDYCKITLHKTKLLFYFSVTVDQTILGHEETSQYESGHQSTSWSSYRVTSSLAPDG